MAIGDFETQKKNLQEQINAAEAEAEFTLDMSEVEKLNKQLEALEATKATYETKVDQAETPATESQIKQVTELGGSVEELAKREEVQDGKVEEVKDVLEKKSEEVVEKVKENELSEKEKQEMENLESDKKWEEGQMEYFKGAIENTQNQRSRYKKILDIPVTFVKEEYMNGIAIMDIPEAEEYRSARSLFNRENTPIDSRADDSFVYGKNPDKERLRKKGLSEEKIEEMAKNSEKYQQIKQKIQNKYGNDLNVLGGFSYSNDFDKKSNPFINIGHGNHTFDASLVGKQMHLGDLLDKEEAIKMKQLKEVENKIKEIEQKKEGLLKK